MHAIEFIFAFGLGAAVCLACAASLTRSKWRYDEIFLGEHYEYNVFRFPNGTWGATWTDYWQTASYKTLIVGVSERRAKRACEAHAKAREAKERKDAR